MAIQNIKWTLTMKEFESFRMSKQNSQKMKLPKELPPGKITIVPDDPSDLETAQQLTTLVNHICKNDTHNDCEQENDEARCYNPKMMN